MKHLLTLLILACAATMAFASTNRAPEDEAINKLCPIGNEAIDGKTFAEYGGHRIGFCCPGCDTKFLAWDTDKKDAFVKASLASQESEASKVTEKAPAPNDPFTLTTCPVSGEKLGSMGEPIAVEAQGSQVKLCCKGCVKTFEADTAKYMEIVNNAIAAQQSAYYPLETCIVSGEPLVEDGKNIAVDVVIGNRLFRTCCGGCAKKLNRDPGKFVAALDAAVIESQVKDYPFETCLIRDKSKLGSMGDPVQRVVGNRLVQFCCKGCVGAFDKDPAGHLAKLDAAWAEQRKGKKESKAAAPKEHGDHDHGKGEDR